MDPFDFVRTIAVARVVMPKAFVRLSAGREAMTDELQALCFLAGANSIFYGEKLLTTGNPDVARDRALLTRLGIEPLVPPALAAAAERAHDETAGARARPGLRARLTRRAAPGHVMQRDPAALKAALADLEQRHLRRTRRVSCTPASSTSAATTTSASRSIRTWSRAFQDAAAKYGVGSGASHLVTGHGPEHEALEEELAAFTGREKALVFSTGYMANMGVIGALADQNASLVSDKLNHASLIDGCRLIGRAVPALSPRRRRARARAALGSSIPRSTPRLLITDGVFSMDGDLAPLPELARAARADRRVADRR